MVDCPPFATYNGEEQVQPASSTWSDGNSALANLQFLAEAYGGSPPPRLTRAVVNIFAARFQADFSQPRGRLSRAQKIGQQILGAILLAVGEAAKRRKGVGPLGDLASEAAAKGILANLGYAYDFANGCANAIQSGEDVVGCITWGGSDVVAGVGGCLVGGALVPGAGFVAAGACVVGGAMGSYVSDWAIGGVRANLLKAFRKPADCRMGEANARWAYMVVSAGAYNELLAPSDPRMKYIYHIPLMDPNFWCG